MSASDNIDSALEIFAVLLFLRHQDLKITPPFIESFLSLREGEVFMILSDLHSIIAVPSADERDLSLRFFHASLGDFLTDHSRSGDTFFLDSGVCHRNIVNRIIKRVMNPPSALSDLEKESLLAVFPEQCLKATPDSKFLSNLLGFDMSLCPHQPSLALTSHITKIFAKTLDSINSASRVPELLVWMQSQKHPDQRNSLFGYHQRSIEIWLREELEIFAIDLYDHPSIENFLHLLASATLVDFPQFRDIHHLIPRVLDLRHTTKSDYHQIEDSDKWEIYVEYRKIVSRFLIDLNRSPLELHFSSCTFFRWAREGQEHYVGLAKYLLSFLSERLYKMEKYEAEIPKAVLIFLPIVFSQAKRSAAARDLLEAGSFNFDPQLPRRFPQENWDQLFLSSYKACKLAIAAEGDIPTIRGPDADIGTENWDQLLSSNEAAAEGVKAAFPEPDAGIVTENRDHLLSSYEASELAIAAAGGKQAILGLDAKIGTSSRGRALHTISRRLKGLFKSSNS